MKGEFKYTVKTSSSLILSFRGQGVRAWSSGKTKGLQGGSCASQRLGRLIKGLYEESEFV